MAFDFRRTALAAALVLAGLGLAGSAAAQPSPSEKETARRLMDQGDDRMDAKDFTGALQAYQGADAIMHLPMTGVAVARAEEALGKLVEARDAAIQVTLIPVRPGENAAYAKARAEALAIADRLAARIPSIQIAIAGAPQGLVVRVDGGAVPAAALAGAIRVNPGKHVITAEAPGFEAARVEVTVAEGVTVPVAPALRPSSAPTREDKGVARSVEPAPRSTSPLVYVGFGVGGAALAVAAVTGGLSISRTAKLTSSGLCDAATKTCPKTAHDDLTAANTLANVSNVTFGVGIAGAALGVVGLFLGRGQEAPRPAAGLTLRPSAGPGFIGVTGTF